jgi:uncharacterized Zn-binding protein involved in type VI secretion
MRWMMTALTAVVLASAAHADPPKSETRAAYCPEIVGEGASTVTAEGTPASRAGDGACAIAVEGSPNVSIEGRPALRVGDKVTCRNGKTGIVVGGASTVFVNGRPLAGAGSRIAGCE